MTHVEVRATVNLPGLPVGALALVDPELTYVRTCLDAGALVPTGRTYAAPPAPQTGAVRPRVDASVAPAETPKRKRKSRAKRSVAPPRDPEPS